MKTLNRILLPILALLIIWSCHGCAAARMSGASVTTETRSHLLSDKGPERVETTTTISGPNYSGPNTSGVDMPAVTVTPDGRVEVGRSGADLYKPPTNTTVFQIGSVVLLACAIAAAYTMLWTLAAFCAVGALALFIAVMYPLVALAVGVLAGLGVFVYAAYNGALNKRLQEIARATLTTVEELPDGAREDFKSLMNARTSTEADALIDRLKARLSLPSESSRTGA